MEEIFEALSQNEPIFLGQAIVAADPTRPYCSLIRRYLGLLNMDIEMLQPGCLYCYQDRNHPEEKIRKDALVPHNEHFAQHFGPCELKHIKNIFRCIMCNTLVPLPPPRSKQRNASRTKESKVVEHYKVEVVGTPHP